MRGFKGLKRQEKEVKGRVPQNELRKFKRPREEEVICISREVHLQFPLLRYIHIFECPLVNCRCIATNDDDDDSLLHQIFICVWQNTFGTCHMPHGVY